MSFSFKESTLNRSNYLNSTQSSSSNKASKFLDIIEDVPGKAKPFSFKSHQFNLLIELYI